MLSIFCTEASMDTNFVVHKRMASCETSLLLRTCFFFACLVLLSPFAVLAAPSPTTDLDARLLNETDSGGSRLRGLPTDEQVAFMRVRRMKRSHRKLLQFDKRHRSVVSRSTNHHPEGTSRASDCKCGQRRDQRASRNLHACSLKDISIFQSRLGRAGIPQYTVQIVNNCLCDCAASEIHVACGWFASVPPPNPVVFRRLGYNDCLVMGGQPLEHGDMIRFSYANSFQHNLRLKSAKFCA